LTLLYTIGIEILITIAAHNTNTMSELLTELPLDAELALGGGLLYDIENSATTVEIVSMEEVPDE
jgi:hypothetical protein